MELMHNCRRMQVKSFDGVSIDTVFILSQSNTDGPAVVLCNPNAGYYEYLLYESEWVEYYTRRNINIVVWNYRGYGESGGSPSTNAILRDGEAIVDHIR